MEKIWAASKRLVQISQLWANLNCFFSRANSISRTQLYVEVLQCLGDEFVGKVPLNQVNNLQISAALACI